jgi:signal transduction histidine kinase
MDLKEAEKQKTLIAERQVSYVRMLVITYGTLTFLFVEKQFIVSPLVWILMGINWTYGLYVSLTKPYEKYPIFVTSWLTSVLDCVLIVLWIYATGGYYSPYHVIFYTSIIAVSFRFKLKDTIAIGTIYVLCYVGLLVAMGHIADHAANVAVRMGFIYIIGIMTNLITSETLYQTQQRLSMQRLAEEARQAHEKIKQNQEELSSLNRRLRLQNNIFNHAEENALIGSYAWHLNTNKLEYSDNLYRLLGCEPGEFEPSMEKYFSFIHPEDKNAVLKNWEKSLEVKKIETSMHRIISKDNKLKYLRTTGRMAGEEDNLLVIGTLQDITEDIELNAEIKQKNIELERSNNELASFNYIASHDLQEPLRKIQTFTKLITEKESEGLNETTKGYMTRISSAAVRMQHLIDAFLNYSRMNNAKLNFDQVDLNSVVDEVINNLADSIQERKITIEKTTLPKLPAVEFQMQQLFINLISNSVKYSKPGKGPVIKIAAKKIPGSTLEFKDANAAIQYWKITVEDNGIGFEPKYSEKIFEVFQRLHNKEEYAGTGIGLAICKKIVLLHRGFITATGIPDQGAAFHIYLPAH